MQCDIPSSGSFQNNNSTITVKSIFADNNSWDAFQLSEKPNLRDVEIKEVNKMMTCKDADRGFFTYYCENCGTVKTVHFGCVRQETTPGIAAMPFLPFGMILLWHASPVMRKCEAHKTMWKTLKVIFG